MNKKEACDLEEENRKRAQRLIKTYLKELARPDRIEESPTNHLASALATLVDKFSKTEKLSGIDNTIVVNHQIPRPEEDKE